MDRRSKSCYTQFSTNRPMGAEMTKAEFIEKLTAELNKQHGGEREEIHWWLWLESYAGDQFLRCYRSQKS